MRRALSSSSLEALVEALAIDQPGQQIGAHRLEQPLHEQVVAALHDVHEAPRQATIPTVMNQRVKPISAGMNDEQRTA